MIKNVNQHCNFDVYGRQTAIKVLKTHALGTMDIERVSDGKWFRITGLGWNKAPAIVENARPAIA